MVYCGMGHEMHVRMHEKSGLCARRPPAANPGPTQVHIYAHVARACQLAGMG